MRQKIHVLGFDLKGGNVHVFKHFLNNKSQRQCNKEPLFSWVLGKPNCLTFFASVMQRIYHTVAKKRPNTSRFFRGSHCFLPPPNNIHSRHFIKSNFFSLTSIDYFPWVNYNRRIRSFSNQWSHPKQKWSSIDGAW